jgi:hypothetical protein
VRLQDLDGSRVNSGRNDGARPKYGRAHHAVDRRLLDLRATAAYLGLAPWTIRELEWRGVLRRVRVPLPNGADVRRLLFDVRDLDDIIERWKDAPTSREDGRA